MIREQTAGLPRIRILPPEVRERVAAGEVIDGPAAVVKELVENSLDAGATHVSIEVQGGGLRLVRVADDGCGIPAEDVELAFQRHATSKIQTFDDLLAVRTLGFRGEALPSIAAVADVTLVTAVADARHDRQRLAPLRAVASTTEIPPPPGREPAPGDSRPPSGARAPERALHAVQRGTPRRPDARRRTP